MSNINDSFNNLIKEISIENFNDNVSMIQFPYNIVKLNLPLCIFIRKSEDNLFTFTDNGLLIKYLMEEIELPTSKVKDAIETTRSFLTFSVNHNAIETHCNQNRFNEMINYFTTILNFISAFAQ